MVDAPTDQPIFFQTMLPVIDIGPLFTGGTEEQLKTSMQIEDALKTTGFLVVCFCLI